MCDKLNLKIIVCVILKVMVSGNHGNHKYNQPITYEYYPKTPIEVWEKNNIEKQLVYKEGDVIKISVIQFNVPNDFSWYRIIAEACSNGELKDVSPRFCFNKNKNTVAHLTTPMIDRNDCYHTLVIRSRNSNYMNKRLYYINHSNETGRAEIVVKYTVDWNNIQEELNISGPYAAEGTSVVSTTQTPVTKVVSTTQVLVTKVVSTIQVPVTKGIYDELPAQAENLNKYRSVVSTTQVPVTKGIYDELPAQAENLNKYRSDKTFISLCIVAGIGACVLLLLLIIWILRKCRSVKHTPKDAPIYATPEVQYAELLLHQDSRPVPPRSEITYSEVKGVIRPRDQMI